MAARGLPIQIIAAFDREQDCLETYSENHPGVECVQCDVTDHDFSDWAGRVDLVLGGIPCEQISAARRGTPLPPEQLAEWHALVDKCLAIPALTKAPWYCYEDVRGILKHLPIFTPSFILDSSTYSAQRRIRAYVGNVPKPDPGNNQQLFGDFVRPGPYRRSMRLKGREPGRACIYNNSQFYPWMPDEKSPTVIGLQSRHDNYAAAQHKGGWRQLEWQEMAALQGFPQDYVFIGSPTRVAKMVAQAVQIDTARAILKALCKA